MPVSSIGLDTVAPVDFVSSGIDGLDAMLAGKGCYRGSTVLVSGIAGAGKSTLAACFAQSTCGNGGRTLYFAFEESASQLMRNMHSVGVDLEASVKKDLLRIEPLRPTVFGLEERLVRVNTLVAKFQPDVVVMDPITSFTSIGNAGEIKSMLLRLLDHLKQLGTTTFLTSLTPGSKSDEETETEVSSMMDTWIIIRFRRTHGARRRQIYMHKALGIGHSQDIGELIVSNSGVIVKPFLADEEETEGAP